MSMEPYEQITLLGLGLMGGSLAAALKKRGFSGRIVGYARREETRSQALELGVVDEVFADASEAVAGADLVILCVPVLRMLPLLEEVVASIDSGAVVTDVGSTKTYLQQQFIAFLKDWDIDFVGSHPMCGSEKTGLDAINADLYDTRMVLVTPTQDSDPDIVKDLSTFWMGVGAKIKIMSPVDHDVMAARTSHLPHLMASILASTVARDGDDGAVKDLCGSGFCSTTRLAEGSPDMWQDIIATNADPIRSELNAMQNEISNFLALMKKEDWAAISHYLENSRTQRRNLCE